MGSGGQMIAAIVPRIVCGEKVPLKAAMIPPMKTTILKRMKKRRPQSRLGSLRRRHQQWNYGIA